MYSSGHCRLDALNLSVPSLLNSQFTGKIYELAILRLPFPDILLNFQILIRFKFESELLITGKDQRIQFSSLKLIFKPFNY